jgi:hypothetical protein
MGKSGLERPARVTLAIRMLVFVIALGIVQTAIVALRHIDVRSPNVLIVTKAVIYSFDFVLLYRLGRGDNWARWSTLPILAIAIPIGTLPVVQSFAHYPLYGLLELAQLCLYVTSIAMLFQKSSAKWFARST